MIYKSQLILLIEEYISCAKYSCNTLYEHYPNKEETLLHAKVLKIIPKEGQIENMAYSFHGRGCFFEYENDAIDVDFGPDGRYDGFDAYRLKQFLKFRVDRFRELEDESIFDDEFKKLINTGVIAKHPLKQSDHLYYLSSSL